MTSENGYNGWTNRSTWAVNLHLSNDQGSYLYVNELAEDCYKDAKGDDVMERKEYAAIQLAEQLESMHDEYKPQLTGIYDDLMTHALGMVFWYEIAKSWIDDMEFEDDEEE